MTVRSLGEHKGRHMLYQKQMPQFLESLTLAAQVESVESSNRIEGVTAGSKRLHEIVVHNAAPMDRSEQEIAGYRDVLADIHTGARDMHLSPQLILEMHGRMLAHTSLSRGQWKERDNAIREIAPDGQDFVRFHPVSAAGTPAYMEKLCREYHQTLDEGRAEPLLVVGAFIFDFSCIHPFWDGNGRMSRLLTLLLLYQIGYEVGRYISLERMIESSKETYYEALLKSSQGWHDAQHDLRPWWNYFLGTLLAVYNEFESRIGHLQSTRGAKQEMVIEALKRMPSRFKLDDLRSVCPGVSMGTIRVVVQNWKDAGRLTCGRSGRSSVWFKREPVELEELC